MKATHIYRGEEVELKSPIVDGEQVTIELLGLGNIKVDAEEIIEISGYRAFMKMWRNETTKSAFSQVALENRRFFIAGRQSIRQESDLIEKLKQEMIKNLLANEEEADKPYVMSSTKTWTRRQLAEAIEKETSDGMEQLSAMLMLALDLFQRGKENIEEFKG